MKLFGRLLCIILITILILSCSAQKKKVLYVFNWTDYIAPELIAQFEKEHNCKIEYDTYNSNENMLTKLITSQSAYDIVVPSGDHVSILMKKDLLEPLDVTKLKNYNNLDPVIMQKSQQFDPGNQNTWICRIITAINMLTSIQLIFIQPDRVCSQCDESGKMVFIKA